MAPFKPVVVPDADGLGVSGANALWHLKNRRSERCFCFAAPERRLAPTIRSRCQRSGPADAYARASVAWLNEQSLGANDPSFIDEVLDAADGAPFTALAIANDPEALAFRTALRQELSDLLNGRANPVATAKLWSKRNDLLLGWMLGLGNGLVRRTLTDDTAVGGRSLDVNVRHT